MEDQIRSSGSGSIIRLAQSGEFKRHYRPDREAVEALRRRRTQQLEERLAAPNWENRWDLIFTAENGGPVYGPALTRQFQRLLERAARNWKGAARFSRGTEKPHRPRA